MANRTQEQVFEQFRKIMGEPLRAANPSALAEAGKRDGGGDTVEEASGAPSDSGGVLGAAVNAAVGSGTAAESPAGSNVQGGAKTEQSEGGEGRTAASLATSFLESGFGMVPLISGLMGLFGGGQSSPQPLLKYEMPSSIAFASADTGSGLSAMDYDQTGAPRLLDRAGAGGQAPAGAGVTPASSSGQQITVNVQAMDAQSFLDNSSQIAQAVRSAMLSMNSINDVVNEL